MSYLETVGASVRAHRERRGWSRRELAAHSGVSERFLSALETGDGNISLRRFADVAHALGTTPSVLLAAADAPSDARPIALLGVRGAGKSSVGAALAKRLDVAFVELDQEIEQAAGLPLGEVFALHGEAYYRRLEHEALEAVLGSGGPLVLATGGGLAASPETWALLRRRALTVWLRAAPEDHWNRVVQQGDRRPMADNPEAMAELRRLLAERQPLYAEADQVVDTSRLSADEAVAAIQATVEAAV